MKSTQWISVGALGLIGGYILYRAFKPGEALADTPGPTQNEGQTWGDTGFVGDQTSEIEKGVGIRTLALEMALPQRSRAKVAPRVIESPSKTSVQAVTFGLLNATPAKTAAPTRTSILPKDLTGLGIR